MPCHPRRKQRHNAGSLGFDTVVTYPFHPLFGQTVNVIGSVEHDFCLHLMIGQAHGGAFYLPAWMTEPEAGSIKPVDTPHLPLESLRDLRALLDQLLHSRADKTVSMGDFDDSSKTTRSVCTAGAAGSLGAARPPQSDDPPAGPAARSNDPARHTKSADDREGGGR